MAKGLDRYRVRQNIAYLVVCEICIIGLALAKESKATEPIAMELGLLGDPTSTLKYGSEGSAWVVSEHA